MTEQTWIHQSQMWPQARRTTEKSSGRKDHQLLHYYTLHNMHPLHICCAFLESPSCLFSSGRVCGNWVTGRMSNFCFSISLCQTSVGQNQEIILLEMERLIFHFQAEPTGRGNWSEDSVFYHIRAVRWPDHAKFWSLKCCCCPLPPQHLPLILSYEGVASSRVQEAGATSQMSRYEMAEAMKTMQNEGPTLLPQWRVGM